MPGLYSSRLSTCLFAACSIASLAYIRLSFGFSASNARIRCLRCGEPTQSLFQPSLCSGMSREMGTADGWFASLFTLSRCARRQAKPGGLSPHKRLPPRENAGPLHLFDGPTGLPLTAPRAVIGRAHRQTRRCQWRCQHVPGQRSSSG
jgi:hypothetical protein